MDHVNGSLVILLCQGFPKDYFFHFTPLGAKIVTRDISGETFQTYSDLFCMLLILLLC